MNNKADGDQILIVMIEEGAAARPVAERPTECMLHEARLEFGRIDRPDFFQADAEFLGRAPVFQPVTGDYPLGERSARALGEERVFAAKLHAASEAGLVLAIATNPQVAGRHPDDLALLAEQGLGGGEAGVYLDAERFGAPREPPRRRAERSDEIAVIAHQFRHWPIGQRDAA